MLAYTAEMQGKSLFISCSDGMTLVTSDWSQVVTFLLKRCDMAVVYNIDRFVDVISQILPKNIAEQLKQGGRVYLPDNTKLYYQPDRVFGITYVDEVNFYGLSRYSDKEITDAHELLNFGREVIKAYETFGVKPTRLTSPIAVYSDVLSKIKFPRASDLPDSALEMLDQCSKIMTKEWRDVYALGHWEADEIADYDLCGAYPSVIACLPDISKATFFESDTLPDKYSWGILKGKLNINKLVTPFNEPTELITTEQLWWLNKYDIGTFEMEHGWFFQLPQVYSYPFKVTMQRLYKARENDNPLVQKIAKGISVGVWGKFAQRYQDGRLADDFNSIYALMTTSRCMVKVGTFIYYNKLENDVVSVMVDGCLATKRLPLSNTREMGTWRENEPSPALVLSVLYQWLNDKRPASMTYPEIMRMIKEHPDSSVYGDVDMNLLEYDRHISEQPRSGGELLSKRFYAEAPNNATTTISNT